MCLINTNEHQCISFCVCKKIIHHRLQQLGTLMRYPHITPLCMCRDEKVINSFSTHNINKKLTALKKMFKSRMIVKRSLVYAKPTNKSNSRSSCSSYVNVLRNRPPIQISQLANGLTVATQDRHSNSTCIGLYVNAGSRYETKEENGITHFFEHLAFKATKARAKTALQQAIETTGAKFNCFTTREMAVYYVECLSSDFHEVLNIFLDCIFNNAFTCEDVEIQRKIVLMEMMEENENYHNILFNYLHLSAFQGTPLEQSVMGQSSNVPKWNTKLLCKLVYHRFTPGNMILTAIGGVVHNDVVELANNYLKCIKQVERDEVEEHRFTGSDMRFRNDSQSMAHVAIAFEGPSFCHKDYNVMLLAKMIVGGWDKSLLGGLNHGTSVARKASYENVCDSYKSFYITYKDTALWGASFISSKLCLSDMTYLLQDEWLKLCTMITDEELIMAKNQLKTKLLMTSESCVLLSHRVGRSLLYRGCYLSLVESLRAIEAINAGDFKTTCFQYLYDKCPVIAAIGPIENMTDYSRVRSSTYWLRI